MLPLFDTKPNEGEHPDSPATRFICWLLAADRTRADAGKRAQALGLRADYAKFYWENVRKR